jgi:hypothetical protein
MDNPRNDFKFDTRVIHRHVRDGKVSQEEYESFLAKLPDDKALAVETVTRFAKNLPSDRDPDPQI